MAEQASPTTHLKQCVAPFCFGGIPNHVGEGLLITGDFYSEVHRGAHLRGHLPHRCRDRIRGIRPRRSARLGDAQEVRPHADDVASRCGGDSRRRHRESRPSRRTGEKHEDRAAGVRRLRSPEHRRHGRAAKRREHGGVRGERGGFPQSRQGPGRRPRRDHLPREPEQQGRSQRLHVRPHAVGLRDRQAGGLAAREGVVRRLPRAGAGG